MQKIKQIIDKIKDLPGFNSCVITSSDGLTIDSFKFQDNDNGILSAIIPSIFADIDKQSRRLGRYEAKNSMLETDKEIISITKIPFNEQTLILFTEFSNSTDSTNIIESIDEIIKV